MINIGKINITSVFEIDAGQVIRDCIEDATPENVKAVGWLSPDYIGADGTLKAQVQSFVVEVHGKTILVDSCVGNGRSRPELSAWGNLQTDFLDRLSKVVTPENVDFVVCTHLHFDHVGWNTTLVDGTWAPTFPNAQYIFCEDEFNYWKTRPDGEVIDDHNGFTESVLPIYEAGLAKLVPNDYRLNDAISLISTPGHTPGHCSVLLESEGQSAIITGDVFHHPCQIAHPEWKTFDTDSNMANKTRKALLEEYTDTDTVFIGSHFAEPVSSKVVRSGSGYKMVVTTQ